MLELVLFYLVLLTFMVLIAAVLVGIAFINYIAPRSAHWFITAIIIALAAGVLTFMGGYFDIASLRAIALYVCGPIVLLLTLAGGYDTYAKSHNGTLHREDRHDG